MRIASRGRARLIWTLTCCWLLSLTPGGGCPAGWESRLSLLQRARSVIQIEILEVGDAPRPGGGRDPEGRHILSADDGSERKDALATVQVLEVLKGECGVQNFKLLGGPYYSCAPFPCYWSFEKGQKLILLLDHHVPAEVSMLAITWRSRVLMGTLDEMRGDMEAARGLWEKRVARRKMQNAEAFVEARGMVAQDPKEWGDLSKKSFATLSSLAILMSDPDALPVGDAAEVKDGVMKTAGRGAVALPAALTGAMEARVADAPEEVQGYHRGIFRRFLVEELSVTKELAGRVTRDDALESAFGASGFRAEACDVRRVVADENEAEIETLDFLLSLSDPTGDVAVWRSAMMNDDTVVRPEVLMPWLRRNLDREVNNYGLLQVLAGMPEKELLPLMTLSFERNSNRSRLRLFLRYFLSVGATKEAMAVLEEGRKFEIRFAQDGSKQELLEKKRDWLQSRFDGFQEVLDAHPSPLPALQEKLKEMRAEVAVP